MKMLSCVRSMLFIMLLLSVTISSYGYTDLDSTSKSGSEQAIKPLFQNTVENYTCADDANSEFPLDLFTDEQLKHGAVVLYLLGALYSFTFLAIVCSNYFLPSVECICADLNIPKDVAAATFMATATTMPEFFTNTISTLVTNSDMGLGTIIGSLMFNTLGVAALSGMAISKPLQLDWWPVTRDCVFYAFNAIILIIITWGGQITFVESTLLVILCITYYVVMFLNHKFVRPIRVIFEDNLNCCGSTRYDLTVPADYSAKAKLPVEKTEGQYDGIFIIFPNDFSSSIAINLKAKCISCKEEPSKPTKGLFKIPEGSIQNKIWWFYSWPIKALLGCLVPSPKIYRKFYPLTFLMCIMLIGINAYVIVWMLTVFGNTIKIPDIVMGLTFLAAGSTMPEALSSLISVRKGESGIGISNALGANSLSILLSLGIPWFIKNCTNYYNGSDNNVIQLNSQGIEYTTGMLLLSTLSLFSIMSLSGFRLRRTVGFALICAYLIFIALQIMIEMNIFFPPSKHC